MTLAPAELRVAAFAHRHGRRRPGGNAGRPAARCRPDHQPARLAWAITAWRAKSPRSSATRLRPIEVQLRRSGRAAARERDARRDRMPRTVRPLHGARAARREGRAVAGAAAAAPGSAGTGLDQQRRGRHQLRHARTRPADARLRSRPAGGAAHRGAPRARRRKNAHARRRRAHALAGDVRDRRRGARRGHRRHHGRRRKRNRFRHAQCPAGIGVVRSHLHSAHVESAGPAHRSFRCDSNAAPIRKWPSWPRGAARR